MRRPRSLPTRGPIVAALLRAEAAAHLAATGYTPPPIMERVMRSMPCPYGSVDELRARRRRETGPGDAALPRLRYTPHTNHGNATYEGDEAFVKTWQGLYRQGPLGKWEVPAEMDEPSDPPEREANPGVLDNLGLEWE